MLGELTIDPRFNGPPGSANGGYAAGRLAAFVEAPAVTVRLVAPPPLGTAMTVHEGVELRHGDRLVATAKPGEITVTVPEVPDPAGAGAALWEEVHPYPTCFGCGPRRERGDALRHMCGPLAGDVVACPACTEPALPHEDGALRPEIVWAGLDCPSAAAVIPVGAPPHVLGTFTVRIDRPVAVGAPHHVIAWPIGAEGRKKWAASALLDASHRVCAVAEALWIEIRQ